MTPKNRPPTHPGEILQEEFLTPLRMTQLTLAQKIGVPVQRVNTLVRGKRGMTAETAVLLARQFKTTPQFWMNLQNNRDIWFAEKKLKP